MIHDTILRNGFLTDDTMPKWNFDVDFLIFDEAVDKDWAGLLSKSVTNAVFPSTKIDKLVTYLIGIQRAYPGKPNLHGELTLTFNDDRRLSIRRILNYLLEYNCNTRFQQDDIDFSTDSYIAEGHTDDEDKQIDIRLRLRNGSGECMQWIVFKDCFVSNIGGLTLDYSSSELVQTTATFVYPYFKIVSPQDTEE